MPEPYGATRFSCRLLGIDCPELRTKDQNEKSLAREARDVVKQAILNKIVTVKLGSKDKYGRLLVRVSSDTIDDLSEMLIQMKLAVPYDGGKKNDVDWSALMAEHVEYMSKQSTTQDDTAH